MACSGMRYGDAHVAAAAGPFDTIGGATVCGTLGGIMLWGTLGGALSLIAGGTGVCSTWRTGMCSAGCVVVLEKISAIA